MDDISLQYLNRSRSLYDMSTGGIIWKLEGGSETLNKKYKIITVVAIGILLLLTYGGVMAK